METSASFEARSAPSPYPTPWPQRGCSLRHPAGRARIFALTILVAFVPAILPSRSLSSTIVRESMSVDRQLLVWSKTGRLHLAAGAVCEEIMRRVPD